MKTAKFLLVAFAALTLFSCSTEIGGTHVDEKMVVNLKVTDIDTRSAGDPVEGGNITKFSAALKHYAVFLNGTTVKDIREIDPSLIIADDPSDQGQTFTQVSSEADNVYIVGNMPVDFDTSVWSVKEAIDKTALPVSSANPAVTSEKPYGIEEVVISGKANLSDDQDGGGNPIKIADITVSPVVARLEIAQIRSVNASTFELLGIFLNNAYTSFYLDGTKPADQYLYLSADADDLNDSPSYDKFTTSNYTGTNNYVPDRSSNKVWAYQIPAGHTPGLIVVLNDVKSGYGSNAEPGISVNDPDFTGKTSIRLLPVEGFTSTNGTPLTIKPGYVYKVTEILFRIRDTGTDSNPSTMSVTLKVTYNPWQTEGANPVI